MGSIILNDLKNTLNNIKLRKCESVLIGDALHYPIRGLGNVGYLHLFLRFIRILFTSSVSHYYTNKITDDDELFVFTSPGRKDGLAKFEKLFNLIGRGSCIEYSFDKKKINISLLSQVPCIIDWYKTLSGAGIEKKISFEISLCLYECYIEVYDITKAVSKLATNFKRATVFCDVMPIDSLLVQIFKNKGIRTVSLQHGMYSTSFDRNVFVCSHSDDYLVGNLFTINEAKSVGRGENMIPVGLIGSIGNAKIQLSRKTFNVKSIGLLLDSSESHDLNLELASFVKEYCSKHKYNLYVKLHPTEEKFKNKYKDIFEGSYFKGIWDEDITLVDYSKKIDIAIVRYSTCLIEMLGLGIPAFSFYSSLSTRDMYINCRLDIRMCDDASLTRLIEKVKKTNYYEEFIQCRDFFYIDNCEENYIRFYNQGR